MNPKERVLMLTNNSNAAGVITYLTAINEEIDVLGEKITLDIISNLNPNWIISYNYKFIISNDIIEYVRGNIINLHTSLLPWNRGSNPNFWSFIEDTPKGVTIHLIDEGLDTGSILLQKEILFDEKSETFLSSYEKLNNEITELFKNNWELIKNRKIEAKRQLNGGSYHNYQNMLEIKNKYPFEWNCNIHKYKETMFGEGETNLL